MSWEDDLGDAVGRLGRAVIDAKMCGKRGFLDDGSLTDRAWNRESAHYYIGEIGSAAQFYRCTRPDNHSYDGGIVTVHPGAGSHFVNDETTDISWDLHQVRVRVHDIVDRWKDIPNPDDIEQLAQRLRDLDSRFGLWDGAYYTKNNHSNPYGLDGQLTLSDNLDTIAKILVADRNGDGVSDETEGLQGGAALAFKVFFQCFVDAVLACSSIVTVCRGAVEAEKSLWDGTQTDIAKTIDAMRAACDTLAGQSSAVHLTLDGALTGATLFLGTVSVIPSHPAVQLGAGGLGLALSIVQVAVDGEQPGPDPVEYVVPTPRRSRTTRPRWTCWKSCSTAR